MKGIKNMKISGQLLLIIILGLLLVLAPGLPAARADGLGLAVGSVTGQPGAAVQAPVSLTSSGEVSMLQFDLGYDPAVLEWNEQTVILAEELGSGFSAEANLIDGRVRVMVYNLNLQQLPAGNKPVVKLTFTVAADAGPGAASPLELHDVVLVGADESDLTPQAVLTDGLVSVPLPVTLELAAGVSPGWAGETVQVPVSLDSGGQVEGLQFDLEYDQQLVTAVEAMPGSGLDPSFTVASSMVDGRLRVMIYDVSGQQIPGGSRPVVTLSLELAPNVATGTTIPLELDHVMIISGGTDLTAQTIIVDGLITVPAAGDLNGDSRIDIFDLAMLAKAFGLTSGDDRWALKYDLVADDIIDWHDLRIWQSCIMGNN